MYKFEQLTKDVLATLPDNFDWPERTLIELLNAGLRALGDIALCETLKIEWPEGAQTHEWKRRRPLMIDHEVRGEQWVRIYDWEYVPALPSSVGLIVFNEELPAKTHLRIWYVDSHPRVTEDEDVISETIAPELATAAGVARALRWQNSRQGGDDPFLMQRWNDARIELARARVEFPIWTPRRINKLLKVKGG